MRQPVLRCLRCLHEWSTRTRRLPKTCPRSKSYVWWQVPVPATPARSLQMRRGSESSHTQPSVNP